MEQETSKDFQVVFNKEHIPVDNEIINKLVSYCELDKTPIIEVESRTNSDQDTFYTLTQLKDGIIDGIRVTFRDIGEGPDALRLVSEVPWRNGTINGNAKYYYPSGLIMEIVPYIDGEVQGIYKCYKENGDLAEETLYFRGEFPGSSLL